MRVGSADLTYRVDDEWEQLPEGWSHPDVPSVAVDADDRVYLFTRSEHPVIVYDRDGAFLGSWGEGIFTKPHHLSVGPDGFVYCVDKDDQTVRKFTRDGELLMTIGEPGVASDTGFVHPDYMTVRRSAGPFNGPTKAAVAPDGRIYVADGYGNTRVHCFSPEGEHLFSWGEPGIEPGQFHIPHSLAVDPDGRVLVADRENSRVQIFSPEGRFLEQWTELSRPDDLVVGPDGRVYIAELSLYVGRYASTPADTPEALPCNVSVWDLGGSLLCRWGDRDSCSPGSFFAPHGIAVDSRGDVYVTEANWSGGGKDGKVPPDCHTVQKFELL